jgi:cysteinyl-tRNA synthetase
MTIRLHDTMARAKVDFVPADPTRVTMYACGPTVYARAHVGNARPAVVFDLLARLIRHDYGAGALTYVRNVTDVDDKINAAATAAGVSISAIADEFEAHYLADMAALGVAPPDVAPHATDHVGQMIRMVERLLGSGHAYEAEGHVLFEVASDPEYGRLSRRDAAAILEGARVEVAPYKRGASDFVLWKPSPEGILGWESPWGRGRPGWHLECSAMIEEHLGETIDIHAGGLDLVFPHHENEIAQSRCAHAGRPLARYWLHNGFLSMKGEKMSKSTGGVVTVADLLAEGHRGETLRVALLSAGYRQPLDWTDALLEQTRARLDGLYARIDGESDGGAIAPAVLDALRDDLNTPAALAALAAVADPADLLASGRLLGLFSSSAEEWLRGGDDAAEIEEMVARRDAARRDRDFVESDRIRAALSAMGVELKDGAGGTTWSRA